MPRPLKLIYSTKIWGNLQTSFDATKWFQMKFGDFVES